MNNHPKSAYSPQQTHQSQSTSPSLQDVNSKHTASPTPLDTEDDISSSQTESGEGSDLDDETSGGIEGSASLRDATHSSASLRDATHSQKESSEDKAGGTQDKRIKIIEQVVRDMAKSAVDSADGEDEAGVVKKSYVDDQDDTSKNDVRNFPNFLQKSNLEDKEESTKIIQKRSSLDSSLETPTFEVSECVCFHTQKVK